MTNKILAFGASSSKNSINKKLAYFTAGQIPDVSQVLLDLNNFEMPIYSIDRETESGIPELAHRFKNHIKAADGIIISFAEHNGAYSTAFKNIFDWISRIEKDVWGNNPMFLLATSPGPRGGKTVLEIAENKFKFMNSNTIFSFSLPSFHKNFIEGEGIAEVELSAKYQDRLRAFIESIFLDKVEIPEKK